MRTLVDISKADIEALDHLAKRAKVSRSALIRKAVNELLERQGQDTSSDAFGLWNGAAIDGLDYQTKLRDEW